MKKSLATLTFTVLALSAIVIPGLVSRYSASAESKLNSSQVAPAASAAAQDLTATTTDLATGMVMPTKAVYALNANNVLFILQPGATSFTRLTPINGTDGNVTGIDFRPFDKRLYALTDRGTLYTIALGATNLGNATKVSTLSPRFDGGYQSLMDFNPVVDAIRLISSESDNYAVVKDANGILNTTAVQTSMTYAVGDVNAGKTPKVIGGAYTNNVAGATTTLFYAMDHDLDTLVTIADKNATGSSNTGGGKLQTIGRLVDIAGNQITVNALADLDIVTINGINFLVGASRDITFQISLNQINPNLPLGTTQNVVVQGFGFPTNPIARSSFIDIAASTLQ